MTQWKKPKKSNKHRNRKWSTIKVEGKYSTNEKTISLNSSRNQRFTTKNGRKWCQNTLEPSMQTYNLKWNAGTILRKNFRRGVFHTL